MFDHPAYAGHEKVLFASDEASGLRAIIAIHNTARGPSLGGCRVWTYPSAEAAAGDALRLARAMTYKSAMADLPLGGGKSVVMVERRGATSPAMFQALGRAIEALDGAYIVAEDVGSSPSDMAEVAKATRHVTGLEPSAGGVGDPSPTTSYGVFRGIEATAAALGLDLADAHVAVQGLGNVGGGVARRLARAGARLTVADIDPAAVARAQDELGASAVPPEAITAVEADILSPNALGGVIDATTIPMLRVRAVAGGANNQLASLADGEALHARGILYAPDYVLNAGGVIKMCGEYFAWPQGEVDARVAAIGPRVAEILEEARRANLPSNAVADRIAEARFAPQHAAA